MSWSGGLNEHNLSDRFFLRSDGCRSEGAQFEPGGDESSEAATS